MPITHGGDIFGSAARMRVPYQHILDFSASINPLGPSPAAREAILTSIDRIVHYPSRSGERLRQRLALEWNIEPNQILTGNGATELLFDWCRQFPNGSIGAPAFGEFHRVWPNATLFPLNDPSTWPNKGPVVLTRPANPTGHRPVRAASGPLLTPRSRATAHPCSRTSRMSGRRRSRRRARRIERL